MSALIVEDASQSVRLKLFTTKMMSHHNGANRKR